MRPILAALSLGCIILTGACRQARADGGLLRFSAMHGDYRITVFTAPTPLREGPVDISVLVQDRETGAPLPKALVSVRMTKPGQRALAYPATFEAATNKLFRAAQFELPASGQWEMQIVVKGLHGTAAIRGEVRAAPALPQWHELWVWIGWPALAVALFLIHRVSVHYKDKAMGRRCRETKKPPELAPGARAESA